MTNPIFDKISDRPKFVKFARLIKMLGSNEAARIFNVTRATLYNWENGRVIISDETFDRVIAGYELTEKEVKLFLDYYGNE